MYGMPLKATGPQYAQESLIAREGCADLIERGLPSDAIKLLRKLDIKSVTDVCTLWILGELFCRYSNEFSRDEFTPEVLKLASRLFDMRKSMPIGLVSPDSKEDYRCGLVVLLVSRLLLAVKAQSLLNNDVVANGEEFRELMKNALSVCRILFFVAIIGMMTETAYSQKLKKVTKPTSQKTEFASIKELLAETKRSLQESMEYDDEINFTSDMAEGFGNERVSSAIPHGYNASDVSEEVMSALTKDYSALMKKIDEKKGR